MSKRVYFCFHYQDVIDFRANVVRNHWLTKSDRASAGFFDASIWERTKLQGEYSIKRLINSGLENTSNTCVLIGSETYRRPWVRYEIIKSYLRGNYLFGVHINGIISKQGFIKTNGFNPFEYVGVTFSDDGKTGTLWELINGKWVRYNKINGSANFPTNVESVFRGKGYNLGEWIPVYDWIKDRGYNNFASWVN